MKDEVRIWNTFAAKSVEFTFLFTADLRRSTSTWNRNAFRMGSDLSGKQYHSFAAEGFRDKHLDSGSSGDCLVFVGERVPDTAAFPTQGGDVTP
jgi:hypothetical protein